MTVHWVAGAIALLSFVLITEVEDGLACLVCMVVCGLATYTAISGTMPF